MLPASTLWPVTRSGDLTHHRSAPSSGIAVASPAQTLWTGVLKSSIHCWSFPWILLIVFIRRTQSLLLTSHYRFSPNWSLNSIFFSATVLESSSPSPSLQMLRPESPWCPRLTFPAWLHWICYRVFQQSVIMCTPLYFFSFLPRGTFTQRGLLLC